MASKTPSKPTTLSLLTRFLTPRYPLYLSSLLLRLILLLYGLYQDAHSPLKYTDIDYLVFTDAARFVAHGPSALGPYERETYRYTPLLAWLLLPTAYNNMGFGKVVDVAMFSFGKILFAAADLAAGWLLERVLMREGGMDGVKARKYAAVWLLNPMVATISTRGSSEGLLGVLVMALVTTVVEKRVVVAGVLLGLGVHFKIYPFIYAFAVVWWMDRERMGETTKKTSWVGKAIGFVTPERVLLGVVSLATFLALNAVMYTLYGFPFLQHTYLHHLTRLDHRHNFSPYNTQLYLSSSLPPSSASLKPESLAFIPQITLSCIFIPLTLAKSHLPTAMLAQTFAFVTFNKVCTSQYFLWYMVLLPLYLPRSTFLKNPKLGITAAVLWVAAQAVWLQQGYELEFLGKSSFLPGLWLASLGFFGVNCWILGIIVGDGGR